MPGCHRLLAYLNQIWSYRYFWLSLVKLDIQTRYRRSILGVGWSLMHPLTLTAVFALVFAQIFQVEPRQYASFVITGILTWNFILNAVIEGCDSITAAERYVRSYPLPMAIYPLRVTLRVGFHFLLLLGATLIITWVLQGFNNLRALPALLPACILLFLFALGVSIVVGISNVYFPDVSHLAKIVLQLAFYLTPVFYPLDVLQGRGMLTKLIQCNVLTHFLSLVREPILNGQYPSLQTYLVTGVTVALLLLLAVFLLVRNERRLVYYLQ